MNVKKAYIRVFGAAAEALGQLENLGDKVTVPEVVKAKALLREAIEDTELFATLVPYEKA